MKKKLSFLLAIVMVLSLTTTALATEVPISSIESMRTYLTELDALPEQGLRFDVHGMRAVVPTRWLKDGDTVTLGDLTFAVAHVPGHSPGHVTFFQKDLRFLLAGDTVFAGSIGRTDFPYGDHEALISGIKTKLLPLGDDVQFLPGHGPASTLGEERQNNPFLQG